MNPGRRTAPNLKMFLIPALALLLALCFSLLLLPADAHAAARTVEVEGVKKGGTVILSNGKSDKATAFEIHIKNIFDKISIRSVTPNKKGIVKINLKGATGYSDEPRWSQGCFTLTPKKAGTVKLTIKGKDDSGKSVACKLTVKVVKYQNPFESFSITTKKNKKAAATKSLEKTITGTSNRFEYFELSEIRFRFRLNKNWVIQKTAKDIDGQSFSKKISNNKTFKLSYSYDEDDGWMEDWIVSGMRLKNKKTGHVIYLRFSLHGGLGGD